MLTCLRIRWHSVSLGCLNNLKRGRDRYNCFGLYYHRNTRASYEFRFSGRPCVLVCTTLEELSFNIKMVIFGEPILTCGWKGIVYVAEKGQCATVGVSRLNV